MLEYHDLLLDSGVSRPGADLELVRLVFLEELFLCTGALRCLDDRCRANLIKRLEAGPWPKALSEQDVRSIHRALLAYDWLVREPIEDRLRRVASAMTFARIHSDCMHFTHIAAAT